MLDKKIKNKKSLIWKKVLFSFIFCLISVSSFAQNNHIGNNKYIDSISKNISQKIISLPQDNLVLNQNWGINILFILSFSIFTFFILKFYNEISLISKAFLNKSYFNQIKEQKNSIFNNLFSFFNISLFIVLTLFIFSYFSQIKSPFENNIPAFLQILYIFIIIVSFYFFLIISSNIWSFFFDEKEIAKIYITNLKIMNLILFSILLISLFFIFFNTKCNISCYGFIFFILLIVYSLRTFNLFRDFFEYRFSLFYLILYLCTIEILPGFIVYKTFFN